MVAILTALFAALLPLFLKWLESNMQIKPPTKQEQSASQQQQIKVMARDAINSKDPAKILTVFAVHDGLLRDTNPSAVAASASGRQNRIATFDDEPARIHSDGRLVAKKNGVRTNPSASTNSVRGTDIAAVVAAGRNQK